MEKLICLECDSESPLQSAACVNCGFPLHDMHPILLEPEQAKRVEEIELDSALICSECQSKISSLEKACQNCGAPIEVSVSSSEDFKPSTAGFFKTSELIQEIPEVPKINRPEFQRNLKIAGGVCLAGLLIFIASIVMRPAATSNGSNAGFSITSMLNPGASNRAKISSVKANMHTVQTILETHAVDWGGKYPKSLELLQTEAVANSYWKSIFNPVNGSEGVGLAMMQYADYSPSEYYAGMVLFEPLVKVGEKEIRAYKIYGADEKGQLITADGQIFFLSGVDAAQLSEYTTPSAESAPTETEETTSNSTTSSSSEEDVVAVVKNWQNIKKNAFVNGNTSSLSSVLTGKALTETEGGVNWWRNNGTFYSIELDSLEVVSTSISDSTATVVVKISETKNNSVNGRKSSTYTATYGLEKMSGSWYISSIAAD